MAVRYLVGTIDRETAKAVLVRFYTHCNVANLAMDEATAWLPKSQIAVYRQLNNCTAWSVPSWLCSKKGLVTTPRSIVDQLA